MSEKLIALQDWEVCAILDGNKTQTRSPLNPQPEICLWTDEEGLQCAKCFWGNIDDIDEPVDILPYLHYEVGDICRVQKAGSHERLHICLEITSVQIEQLLDISAKDVEEEGIDVGERLVAHRFAFIAQRLYAEKWDGYYGATLGATWKDDPWVATYTFKTTTL